ncbi:MAG TPA: hypothetical protein VF137_08170 [Candidatus Dormibacteraeota bacterium]
MKLPPRLEPPSRTAFFTDERDLRFLVFVGFVLAALALGLKSELVAPSQVWWLSFGLVVLAAPALFAYLHGQSRGPALEHFMPVAIGAVVVAGLSLLIVDWWQFALASAAFGLGFGVAAHLDYRHLSGQGRTWHEWIQEALLAVPLAGAFLVVLAAPFPLALQVFWIGLLALAANYRSFRVLGTPLTGSRAFLLGFFVALVVAMAAWAMSMYLHFQEGAFAVILLLVWYISRGVLRHAFEDSLTRQVLIEYGAFGLLLAYLFWISNRPS